MLPNFTRLFNLSAPTEFSVENGDFSDLEIRDGGKGDGFHFFYDTGASRLITDFVIDDRQQVATLCEVTLIKKDEKYSPRLRFWKRDKTKRRDSQPKPTADEQVDETEATQIIKAMVDVGENSTVRQNLWKLIGYLQSLTEVEIPDTSFHIVASDSIQLAQALSGQDRDTLLQAVRITIGDGLSEEDLRRLSNRKAQLGVFKRLLEDADYFASEQRGRHGPEAVWQGFFEANPWIFGYGLRLVACAPLQDESKLETITTGRNIFGGAGKRVDALMRTRGYISSLVFCEIKTHTTALLEREQYRKPDVYQVSKEVSGGLAQLQKTATKAVRRITDELHTLREADGTPMGVEVSTIKPRQTLIVGNLAEFDDGRGTNLERLASFELFRNSIHDVEIVTFDELYERAYFIVSDD